jgi:peroxiredoxin (alkyl hydroperoxide reductase subunit C)
MDEFRKRDTQVLGVSIDDAESHANWRQTEIAQGGIGPVGYPLLCDEDRSMTKAYDVLHEETTFAMRGTFLIGKDGMVMVEMVNNLPLGRNVDEVLRLLDAMDFLETSGQVCPAGWAPGKDGMTPSEEGVASYLAKNADSL